MNYSVGMQVLEREANLAKVLPGLVLGKRRDSVVVITSQLDVHENAAGEILQDKEERVGVGD